MMLFCRAYAALRHVLPICTVGVDGRLPPGLELLRAGGDTPMLTREECAARQEAYRAERAAWRAMVGGVAPGATRKAHCFASARASGTGAASCELRAAASAYRAGKMEDAELRRIWHATHAEIRRLLDDASRIEAYAGRQGDVAGMAALVASALVATASAGTAAGLVVGYDLVQGKQKRGRSSDAPGSGNRAERA